MFSEPYDRVVELLKGQRLPAALLDLDAFERNVDRHAAQARALGVPLRVASKSVRSAALLARALERGSGALQGVLCYAAREALALAERGFTDLLVAYPAHQRDDVDALAHANTLGAVVRAAVDSEAGLEALGAAGVRAGGRVPAVLDVDMATSVAGGRVYLGVRRSPLREPDEVCALARRVAAHPGLRFAGLLAYEAQVAGLPDASPHRRLENPARVALRALSARDVARRRRALVAALAREGLACELVNGGGTGSLDSSTRASGVTEVAAGSGLYKPVLFDHYRAAHVRALEPALGFALEVTRVHPQGYVTCLGGGYVASGPPGLDRVALPVAPPGLELLPMEMTGEVQTPLRVLPGARAPAHGEPVLFRHAKAGELLERFDEVLLVRDGAVVERARTYRGEGWCFF